MSQPIASDATTQIASIAAIQAASPGWLDRLDVQAAALLADLAGEARAEVRLALALASRQLRQGHVCLDLRASAATAGPLDEDGQPLEGLRWPVLEGWLAALSDSPLVLTLADGVALDGFSPEPIPLVLELPSARLYLRRYWEHEAALAALLLERASSVTDSDHGTRSKSILEQGLGPHKEPGTQVGIETGLDASLARLFPAVEGPSDQGRRDQSAAVALAARRRLAVITGGPGTGKTSTVLRLLALLVEQARDLGQPPPRILLMAPTGKASARLEESVIGALDRLPVDAEVRDAIPGEAQTIHRALGWRPDGLWHHGLQNRLAAEVVVVDEASMIDLALMRALVEALRPEARLILLGDRDQLSSVDAGAVLGDICGDPAPTPDSEPLPTTARGAAPEDRVGPPIADCIARLRYSFRFGAESGIGALSRAIQAGDADAALDLLRDPAHPDVSLVTAPAAAPSGRLHPELLAQIKNGYGAYLDALGKGVPEPPAIGAALDALARFRLLCAHRQGPAGVARMNRAIVDALEAAGRIAAVGENWRGRPILVTRNDPSLGLFNGDVGLIAPDVNMDGRLRAFFLGPDGRPRAVAPPRLPPHESVFGMSIHKSQGSEFDRIAVLLPLPGSPLLSRELLYTAVTRARKAVLIFGSEESIEMAIRQRVERASGLRQRLWGVGTGPPEEPAS